METTTFCNSVPLPQARNAFAEIFVMVVGMVIFAEVQQEVQIE